MVGNTHLCGCGGRCAVHQSRLPAGIWWWQALKGMFFLLWVHSPLQKCPVLRYHYPRRVEEGKRQT